MKARLFAVFADTPFVFFAVVIGVALTFRLGVGVVREAKAVPDVAPTFTTGPEPGLEASPKTAAAASTPAPSVEVGAAARVQPFGTTGTTGTPQPQPQPARVAPRPRGHGRKPTR